MQSSLISYEPLGACDFVKNKIRIYISLQGVKGTKTFRYRYPRNQRTKISRRRLQAYHESCFLLGSGICLSLCLCLSLHLSIKKEIYISTYIIPYFLKIVASGSNFSLCIVMEKDNTVSDIENLNNPISGDFVYHRWDLNRWPAPFCRHFSRYATQGLFIFFSID